MPRYTLRLFVTGKSPSSDRAISNLRQICETELAGRFEMVVIDVLERPQVAEEAGVMATPTLIKQSPPPLRRIIGDLSDFQQVLIGLDLGKAKLESRSKL